MHQAPQRLPFSELQLSIPSLITPNLQEPQHALFIALLHLGQARGLRIAVVSLQILQQRESLQKLNMDLIAGPLFVALVEAASFLSIILSQRNY